MEAAKEDHLDAAAISRCLKGKQDTYHDMIWLYDGDKRGHSSRTPVKAFDINTGALIAEYSSLNAASIAIGCCARSIRVCCKREKPTYKGMIWRYSDDTEDVLSVVASHKERMAREERKINRFDAATGDYIETFDTAAAAASTIKDANTTGIISCCNHHCNSYLDSIWRYNTDMAPVTPAIRRLGAFDVKSGALVYMFRDAEDATRYLDVNSGCIMDCCHGRHKTHKGYTWRYLTPEEIRNYREIHKNTVLC